MTTQLPPGTAGRFIAARADGPQSGGVGGGLPAASDDQRAAQYFLAGVLGAPPQVQRRQHFGPARLAQTRLAHSMTGLTQRRFIATSALSTETGAAFAVMTCAANSAHAARPSEKLVRLLMVPSELKLPPLAAISIVIRRRGMRKPLSGRGSVLHLPRRLIDRDLYRHALRAAAAARSAHRGGSEIVQTHRDAHVGVGRADAVGRIERAPADARHVNLRPGMAGVLLRHAVGAVEITADITRRNVEMARGRDEDVSQVLAHAAPEREGFCGSRCAVCRIGVVGHLGVDAAE